MLGAPSAADTALLDSSNATLISPAFASSLGHAARRLLAGRTVRLFVVGGSASAGAGGIGVNNTFDAKLTAKLNAHLAAAEASSGRTLGRIVRSNVAQGGTTSFWASLMAEALHGTQPHLLLWEYSINDHAVSLEAASRISGRGESRKFSDETMRYMLDHWLHRALTLGAPPPALLLAYLWDKQPAAAFKAGNRALCKRMPVPASAFNAQRPVLEEYSSRGAGFAALNMAAYVTKHRYGGSGYCPLVADGYYHPSNEGHELIADLLALIVRRLLHEGASEGKSSGGKGGGKGGGGQRSATAVLDLPTPRHLPRSPLPPSAPPDSMSPKLDALLSDTSIAPAVTIAWEPKWHSPREVMSSAQREVSTMLMSRNGNGGDGGGRGGSMIAARPRFASPTPPPIKLFAKSVKERADRKWMWLVPVCKRDNSSHLTMILPTNGAASNGNGGAAAPSSSLRAISYFGMVSPGARLRHTIGGKPVAFDPARGSFLANSWGYLQMWHVFEEGEIANAAAKQQPLEWKLCAEHVSGDQCKGFRCGLEFKMPMKTAAVGWFLALGARS